MILLILTYLIVNSVLTYIYTKTSDSIPAVEADTELVQVQTPPGHSCTSPLHSTARLWQTSTAWEEWLLSCFQNLPYVALENKESLLNLKSVSNVTDKGPAQCLAVLEVTSDHPDTAVTVTRGFRDLQSFLSSSCRVGWNKSFTRKCHPLNLRFQTIQMLDSCYIWPK